MKKRVVINGILFILFVVGLFVLLSKASFVLRQKQYAGVQDHFAKLPQDSVEIVFIGNSHQFCSISPQVLYDEYGVESFMLATSAQTIPMSYYAAMEAIEMQHPDTIVLEVSYCANDFRTVSEEMSHCFFDGMPRCKTRKLALEDLIEKGDQIYYYLPLGYYHTRWKEMTSQDYSITLVDERGGVYYEQIKPNGEIPLIPKEEMEPMPQEMEKYMDQLIELCRLNEVKLILYTAPFNTLWDNEDEKEGLARRQRIFNYIGEYAQERQVEYHNLFYEIDQLGLDGQNDWMDTQHLNAFGQQKLTRYMMDNGYLE